MSLTSARTPSVKRLAQSGALRFGPAADVRCEQGIRHVRYRRIKGSVRALTCPPNASDTSAN